MDPESIEACRDEPGSRLFINSFMSIIGQEPSYSEIMDHLKFQIHSLIYDKYYIFHDS